MSLHFLGLPNGASRYYGIQARQDALMMAATTLRSETLRELVLASMYVRHAQIGPRPTVQQSMRAGEVSGVPVLCFTVDVEKANPARARARARVPARDRARCSPPVLAAPGPAQTGVKRETGMARHADVLLCPVGAIAMFLFCDLQVNKTRTLDLSSRSAWYNELLTTSSYDVGARPPPAARPVPHARLSRWCTPLRAGSTKGVKRNEGRVRNPEQ